MVTLLGAPRLELFSLLQPPYWLLQQNRDAFPLLQPPYWRLQKQRDAFSLL